MRDITKTLRDYADAMDNDRGFATGVTETMRDAAAVIEEQDTEIARLQAKIEAMEIRPDRAQEADPDWST